MREEAQVGNLELALGGALSGSRDGNRLYLLSYQDRHRLYDTDMSGTIEEFDDDTDVST
jgi:hypothetical protein